MADAGGSGSGSELELQLAEILQNNINNQQQNPEFFKLALQLAKLLQNINNQNQKSFDSPGEINDNNTKSYNTTKEINTQNPKPSDTAREIDGGFVTKESCRNDGKKNEEEKGPTTNNNSVNKINTVDSRDGRRSDGECGEIVAAGQEKDEGSFLMPSETKKKMCENTRSFFPKENYIWSATGVQQGDPLGPLLFALVLHPLVHKIRDRCKLLLQAWYLDDGTVIGDSEEVAKALDIIRVDGPGMGLELNIKKT